MVDHSRGQGHPEAAPLMTVIGLLVLFGGSSIAFAGYLARRRRREAMLAGQPV